MAMRVEQNVTLAGRCTLAVGGAAEHLVCARSEAEVGEALWWAKRRGMPVQVLGGGSNSLIADEGLPGLTLQPKILGKTVAEAEGEVLLEVGAGAPWDSLVAHTVEEGLCGIEALSGIPGWAGAAPIQNIGAYGQEVAQTLRAVRLLRRDRGRAEWVDASELDLGYRSSKLRGPWRDQFVVLALRLALRRGRPDPPRYGELRELLGGQAETPAEVREAVLKLRAGKSMLYDRRDPNHRSAGSFFVNPRLDAVGAEVLRGRAIEAGLDPKALPLWPDGEGFKTSAAWLMERSGFGKGYAMGAAGLSSNHCLGLINRGGAGAEDLVRLANRVRAGVAERFGLVLEPEPAVLGFASSPWR